MRLLVTLILILTFHISNGQEISLFNSEGKATAYVADDDDLTILLWSGTPVAYISGDNVYGFNGKHLGWWVKGIIRDHEGNAVGATKDATSMRTEYEPYKGYKEYKPYKSYKEYAPYKPYWTTTWSNTSLKMFLLLGKSD